MQRLMHRVRLKRGLVKLHRLLLVGIFCILVLFLADFALGLNVLSLRVAGIGLAVSIMVGLALGSATTALVRLDLIGVAHLLEQRYPELAERLVTLVQLQREPAGTDEGLAPLMKAETVRKLASVSPETACPLDAERRLWTRAAIFLAVYVGLLFAPSFLTFNHRFVRAWATPLVPYRVELVHGNGHVLSGSSHVIEAQVDVVDPFAEPPSECQWHIEGAGGHVTHYPMKACARGRFEIVLDNVREPVRGRAVVGPARSESIHVGVVAAPNLTQRPTATITPPSYIKTGPRILELDDRETKASVLQYSKISYEIRLDRPPAQAALVIATKPLAESATPITRTIMLACDANGIVRGEEFALACGAFQAEMVLTLEHGVIAKLQMGHWNVHADKAPRFSELRFHGSAAPLQSSQVTWITPDDVLRLQAEVTDEEGLAGVAIEFRVNDKALPTKPWLNATGRELQVDQWLPLPQGLNKGDHVQFRLHALDRRTLRKGEIVPSADSPQPPEHLAPQITIAPAPTAGEDGWIHLRIDGSRDAFVRQQAQVQREEMRKIIDDIKKKLLDEAQQADNLKRTIHQQAVLTPERRREADKLRLLNHQIVEDLLQAGANPNLARLAAHFFDIADMEMKRSADALKRFSEPDRSLADSKQELDEAQSALMQAHKKLDRMLQWNDQLALDRLDQAQLEHLAKRQLDLKNQLEKLRAGDPPSEADLAKQIEAIRQEQARLSAEVEQLQMKNKLVQESIAALGQKRAERLAETAQKLVAEQRALRELPPEKISPAGKEQINLLAKRQLALADRVEPYAVKNDGPDLTPARAAARSLTDLHIEEAIGHQRSHEKRLRAWFDKFPPAEVVKNPALRARVEQIERFGGEQEKIRLDTERLLNELLKAVAAKEGLAMREKLEKLAKELLELAQKAESPEAKAMAKEGAESVAMAQKAMQASDDAKAKGDAEPAKMLDEEASKQLELAAKMLQKFVQDQATKGMAKEDSEKTAEALKQSSEQMKIAEAKLPNMPKEAQNAMQAAADKLAEAVNQASKQSTARLPSAARTPSTQASTAPSRSAGPLPKDFKLEPMSGKSWGELPGQLKTEMIQDFRNRFGAEYADLIQQYFERLAQTPLPARKE